MTHPRPAPSPGPLPPLALRRRAAGLSATALLGLAALLGGGEARALEVAISFGLRSLYLQVGTGALSSAYLSGGTPGNNATINTVTASIAAGAVGSGPRTMGSDSSVDNSPYNDASYCNSSAGDVYVGGFYRTLSLLGSDMATLTVSTPASLASTAGATLPFSMISWVSGGQDENGTSGIRSGSFTGGTQSIAMVRPNTWFESCLRFSYANGQMVPAGTFTGRAIYQLSAT